MRGAALKAFIMLYTEYVVFFSFCDFFERILFQQVIIITSLTDKITIPGRFYRLLLCDFSPEIDY